MDKIRILFSIYTNMAKVYFLSFLELLKIRMSYGSIRIRSNTTDFHVFHQLFLYDDYKLGDLGFQPEFIVDAGAYCGYSALFFHLAYPKALIHSIEPADVNFEVLKHNTRKMTRLKLWNAGLWNKNTHLKLVDRKTGNWGFQTIEVPNGSDFDIKTVDVDTILKEAGMSQIDIFKIDIEGSEMELFSENYANWIDKVRIFIIEFHERVRPGCTDVFLNAISNHQWKSFQRGENMIYVRQDWPLDS